MWIYGVREFPLGPEIGADEIFHIESGWREKREKVSLWDKVSYVRLVQPFSRDFILLIIQLRYYVRVCGEWKNSLESCWDSSRRRKESVSMPQERMSELFNRTERKVTMTISNLYSYEEEIDILMKTTTNLKCEISPHHRIAWIHLNKDETLSSKFSTRPLRAW